MEPGIFLESHACAPPVTTPHVARHVSTRRNYVKPSTQKQSMPINFHRCFPQSSSFAAFSLHPPSIDPHHLIGIFSISRVFERRVCQPPKREAYTSPRCCAVTFFCCHKPLTVATASTSLSFYSCFHEPHLKLYLCVVIVPWCIAFLAPPTDHSLRSESCFDSQNK